MDQHRIAASQPGYSGPIQASVGPAEAEKEPEGLRQAKDTAYRERNQLVAFLSRLYPYWLAAKKYEEGEEGREGDWKNDWDDEWKLVVFVLTPAGQMSWHIHDSEREIFSHLEGVLPRESWDGHSTEQKYERLEKLP